MRILALSAALDLTGRIAAAARRLHAVVLALLAARRGRRALAWLAECDDRLLDDMGLSRADVARALARPATSDPSEHLARIVAEKARRGG